MSLFDDMHKNAAAAMLPVLGDSVTYTPSGGSATTIYAIVNRDGIVVDGVNPGDILNFVTTIQVSKADVTTVTKNVDTVALKRNSDDASDTTMTVQSIIDESGGMWHLEVR